MYGVVSIARSLFNAHPLNAKSQGAMLGSECEIPS